MASMKIIVRKLYCHTCCLSFLALCLMLLSCSGGGGGGGDVAAPLIGHIDTTPSFVENFDSAIDESVWQIATWVEESITSRDRCYVKDGYLNLIFKYVGGQNLGAAIQTRNTFLYGRWEARLKPSSVAGVLNSFYTIDWGTGDGTKQEIDIEFLTFAFGSGTGKVHYAVHAEGLTSKETNPDIVLGFNPSDDFHIYGFEITPEHIQWLVDGVVFYTYTYSGNAITINAPYQLKLNVWSAVTWVQGPPIADTDCVYQIDWIKFYPYISN